MPTVTELLDEAFGIPKTKPKPKPVAKAKPTTSSDGRGVGDHLEDLFAPPEPETRPTKESAEQRSVHTHKDIFTKTPVKEYKSKLPPPPTAGTTTEGDTQVPLDVVNPQIQWAQRDEIVYVTICAQNLDSELLEVEADRLHFAGTTKEHVYDCTLNFFERIDVDKAVRVQSADPRNIFLELPKQELLWWPRLTKEKGTHSWIKIDFPRWEFKEVGDGKDQMGVEKKNGLYKLQFELKNQPTVLWTQNDSYVWITFDLEQEDLEKEELRIEDHKLWFKCVTKQGVIKEVIIVYHDEVYGKSVERLPSRRIVLKMEKRRKGRPWWPRLLKHFRSRWVPWVRVDHSRCYIEEPDDPHEALKNMPMQEDE